MIFKRRSQLHRWASTSILQFLRLRLLIDKFPTNEIAMTRVTLSMMVSTWMALPQAMLRPSKTPALRPGPARRRPLRLFLLVLRWYAAIARRASNLVARPAKTQ